MSKPKVIDLFCGAGGFALGLKEAGFDIVASVEFDSLACRTYRRNFGEHLIERDIHALSVEELLKFAGLEIGECALLAGGPPCQGFSIQRRGSDDDPRNDLVLQYLRFVEGIMPKFFLMENVSGLMSKRGTPFLEKVLNRVSQLGYKTYLKKIEAAEFGVPQMRKRVILVGELNAADKGNFVFPEGGFTAETYRTVRDAIANLPSPPADGRSHIDYANHAREIRIAPINLERLTHIPPGGGREYLPDHLQLPCHKNNPGHRHMDVYGRLAWDAPSGTITARFDSFTRGKFAHPVEHRSVTLREGARLQTFPDSFVFEGNRGEVARQIGNAVPPLLARALGESILQALGRSDKKSIVELAVGATICEEELAMSNPA